MNIMISDICGAFNRKTVGSRVKKFYRNAFMIELQKAIWKYEADREHPEKVPGQYYIEMPGKVNDWVYPGSGVSNGMLYRPKDFVVREHRGHCAMFLKRKRYPYKHADHVACIVYTRKAYENDPDFTPAEANRVVNFFGSGDGYVLVAVLASSTENPHEHSTVSYGRFVKNLAGANNEYKVMTKDELVKLAEQVDYFCRRHVSISD